MCVHFHAFGPAKDSTFSFCRISARNGRGDIDEGWEPRSTCGYW